MTARLQNHMRAQALLARGAFADPCLGVITSLDTANYCAKVAIEPDNVETGWLPITSQWVGAGWGLYAPIPVGTQVLVLFSEANREMGIIAGALYCDRMRPLDCPEGEFWLVHKGGASLKFFNDGTALLKAPAGLEIEADTNITGALTVTGEITDNTPGNSVTVKALRDAYNAHKHPGVQTGAGITATTDTPAS
jgi:phage baseplate assembly protein V